MTRALSEVCLVMGENAVRGLLKAWLRDMRGGVVMRAGVVLYLAAGLKPSGSSRILLSSADRGEEVWLVGVAKV